MIRRLPRFQKVLFCLPLRCGLIALIYLNVLASAGACMGFGFLDIIKAIGRMFTMHYSDQMHRIYRSKVNPTLMFLALAVYLLSELAMSVVALIGIHKHRQKLLIHYLYFNVGATVFMLFTRMFDVNHFYWYFDVLVVLSYLLIKLYHILCIRSFIKSNMFVVETKQDNDVEMDIAGNDLCEHDVIEEPNSQYRDKV